MTVLRRFGLRPWAELTWRWQVAVVLIVTGPMTVLGVLWVLVHTWGCELKDWMDWMSLFVLMDIISVLGHASLHHGNAISSYALWRERKGRMDVAVVAYLLGGQWLAAAFLGPVCQDGIPSAIRSWLQTHFPSAATQLGTSDYLSRRALVSSVAVFWICMMPLELLAAPVLRRWARYRRRNPPSTWLCISVLNEYVSTPIRSAWSRFTYRNGQGSGATGVREDELRIRMWWRS
ncbi:hypothetical protein CALCODRAFT_503530 [Calocera cornea HHB12733]|uniref:Uncharacterized protein n=1 Tax=Calocera cornea HHB12733 TaxID=1353952 RepID=A0A165CUG2_9BASI|nr:hypothetical protein CALCODRAFT_503530 [Calocera cornea HHB12733]